MATNKLLPFANGVGANVTDYDTWSALTTLLSQGFTTGVARSDYANRVFAQGALASYILGQFVVDQTAQDADLNETTFYTNFKNALLTYIKANSVTLNTTQTIGGTKTFSTTPKAPTATAGDNSTKVATTAFVKKAIDDHTDSIKPVSYGEQTLTDAEKTQARTNIGAIDDVNVVHINDAQTITGTKTFNAKAIFGVGFAISRNLTTNFLSLLGGTDNTNGASIVLNGADRSGNEGSFSVKARNAANGEKAFVGAPDGTLTWDGNPILDSTSGVTLDTAQTITGTKTFGSLVLEPTGGVLRKDTATSVLRIRGGTSNGNGAYIGLNGSSRSSQAGEFEIVTGATSDSAKTLRGASNGTLTWDSKEIERVSESGAGYIRYESGIQICFGTFSADAVITFAQAFKDTNYAFSATPSASGSIYADTKLTTGISTHGVAGEYVAVGFWK